MKGVLLLIFIAVLTSCKKKDKAWSELPEVTNLTNLKQTDFVTTLENPISSEKNFIYAPTFLFAWEKILGELKSQIIVSDTNSNDFKLLTRSKSHINSLTEDEYTASVIVDDGEIIARAFFNRSLPFETKLQSLDKSISFNKTTKVAAFGMNYFEEDAVKFTKILYYQDDDNFILQLTPRDKQHEIILVKGLPIFRTLADALRQANSLIEKGKNEATDSKQSWKYKIVEGDIFSIPTIKFNIATNYRKIEGQRFLTRDNKKHFVAEAFQRTGLILNENGAVVESEAMATVDSTSVETVIRHPKRMVFDESFLVIVKRKEQRNPYFVMTINNTELLTKK